MTPEQRERLLRQIGGASPYEYDGAHLRDERMSQGDLDHDSSVYDRRILLVTVDKALAALAEAEQQRDKARVFGDAALADYNDALDRERDVWEALDWKGVTQAEIIEALAASRAARGPRP